MIKKQKKFTLIQRGFKKKCPVCGKSSLYSSYIKLVSKCVACQTDFTCYQTDDGPAYCTIFIVGHVIIPMLVVSEGMSSPPPILFQFIFWPLLTIVTSIWLLPRVKGAFLAFQISVKDTST